MKKYAKAKMIAKNLPTGSYAAGCALSARGGGNSPTECRSCERAQ